VTVVRYEDSCDNVRSIPFKGLSAMVEGSRRMSKREGSKMKSRRHRGLISFQRPVFGVCLSGGLAMAVLAATPGVVLAHPSSPLGQAKRSLLVASDLPAGWTSTKSSNNNSSFPGADQLAGCLGVSTSLITSNPPTANSPEFDSKNQLQSVNDSVSVYPSAKAAHADFASLADSKTPSCLTQVLNGRARSALASQLGSGATLGTVLVSRSTASEFAPGSANFTAFMPITTRGITLNLQLTVIDYVKGRNEQTVVLTSVQSPFPTSLARHLTTVAVGRL